MAKTKHRRYKTTPKDFERFKKYFLKVIKAYRLQNWELVFEHEFVKNNRAEVDIEPEDEKVTVRLSTDWAWHTDDDGDGEYTDVSVTAKTLRSTALHEVRHILLSPLCEALDRYGANEDDIRDMEHKIMGKMEKADEGK